MSILCFIVVRVRPCPHLTSFAPLAPPRADTTLYHIITSGFLNDGFEVCELI